MGRMGRSLTGGPGPGRAKRDPTEHFHLPQPDQVSVGRARQMVGSEAPVQERPFPHPERAQDFLASQPFGRCEQNMEHLGVTLDPSCAPLKQAFGHVQPPPGPPGDRTGRQGLQKVITRVEFSNLLHYMK
jgi:hypothetical protein